MVYRCNQINRVFH